MAPGINYTYMDPEITPGEDFYLFVNGGWMCTTEIPEDRSSWGSFHELSKETDQKVLDILDHELITPGAADNIAARLFETGMDKGGMEKAGLKALEGLFAKINHAGKDDIPGLLGFLNTLGGSPFIHHSVHPDLGDSHKYASYLEAPALGLPEREYYLDQDEKAIEIKEKYKSYISMVLLEEAGYSSEKALEAAQAILEMETSMATQMMTKEDMRQMDKLYNPKTPDQISEMIPDWPWVSFLKTASAGIPEQIIVTDPTYFVFLNGFINTIPLERIKDYLRFALINKAAPFSHKSLEKAHFGFYVTTLEGTTTMRPRKERLVKVVNSSLGEALGQLFVSKHFPPQAKESALEMVDDIVAAFKDRFSSMEWMDKSTRAYALEKLSAFKVKIGYPDKWKDYAGLTITPVEKGGSYLGNILAIAEWKSKKDSNRIGKEVDTEEWFMAPQVVNAYYNPMFNEIVFPAAILQPPFFNWEADAAVNYGGIGAVIGHEITHGFDDQGSRLDKEGNLNEWWTKDDRTKFGLLTKSLIDQFDNYFPFEDLPLNGTFTLGENIADLGGLSVAYDALQRYYKRHGKPGPIDGYTPEQRFFMSWATVWRTKTRPEALRNQIKTDPHPPGQFRAVAAPSNMDVFYDAFDISPKSKWYREKENRIKIW